MIRMHKNQRLTFFTRVKKEQAEQLTYINERLCTGPILLELFDLHMAMI